MNSAPVCTPTEALLDSGAANVDGELSTEYSDTVEAVLPCDGNRNGCASVDDDCEKLTDSDSEDGCDDLSDDSPNHRLIMQCQYSDSTALDLSRCGLKSFCRKLLKLSQLQYLYLEGNHVASLPEDFFQLFPNLKWLDLRHNKLVVIPSIYLRNHQNLQTVLLEGNQLRTLPLELGLVQSLDGLNIRNNPLEFPPPEVLQMGTKKMLSFLRRLLQAKSEASKTDDGEPVDVTVAYDSDDIDEVGPDSSKRSGGMRRRRSSCLSSLPSYRSVDNKAQRSDPSLRCISVGSATQTKHLTQSERYLPPNDDLVTDEKVQAEFFAEKKRDRVRKTKIRQDKIIDGMRHKEMVKDWKDETRKLQQKKLQERRMKGYVDYVEPATNAPFHIESDDLKMIDNDERLNQRLKKKSEEKPRPMSPASQQRRQEIRAEKERLLRERIQLHAEHVRERRSRPTDNPADDMRSAQRELEIALQLQKEVELRRKELEYRFTAHAADAIDAAQRRKK